MDWPASCLEWEYHVDYKNVSGEQPAMIDLRFQTLGRFSDTNICGVIDNTRHTISEYWS